MSLNDTFSTPGFNRSNTRLTFACFAVFVVVWMFSWYVLPEIQSLIIPRSTGGNSGYWVVRPIAGFRSGASVVLAVATVVLLFQPLRRLCQRTDEMLSVPSSRLSVQTATRTRIIVKSVLLLTINAGALVFYLFSWTTIGPGGIQRHLPWGTRQFSFDDIESLETIPYGYYSATVAEAGPWYCITFRGGRHVVLSYDNEGMTYDELTAITSHVADRAGLKWVTRGDTHVR